MRCPGLLDTKDLPGQITESLSIENQSRNHSATKANTAQRFRTQALKKHPLSLNLGLVTCLFSDLELNPPSLNSKTSTMSKGYCED